MSLFQAGEFWLKTKATALATQMGFVAARLTGWLTGKISVSAIAVPTVLDGTYCLAYLPLSMPDNFCVLMPVSDPTGGLVTVCVRYGTGMGTFRRKLWDTPHWTELYDGSPLPVNTVIEIWSRPEHHNPSVPAFTIDVGLLKFPDNANDTVNPIYYPALVIPSGDPAILTMDQFFTYGMA